jgi:hypothetical protein
LKGFEGLEGWKYLNVDWLEIEGEAAGVYAPCKEA